MEFMNFLVSKECSFFDSLSANSKFQSQEIDLKVLEAFFQVLENEIYGLKELEKLKRRLYRHRYCDFRKIFDLMDVDKKGYLDLRDIYDFMKSEDPRISYAESERTLRRLDHNGDKKIDF
jgi:Ca2+-binding EF-hand superfamily protein